MKHDAAAWSALFIGLPSTDSDVFSLLYEIM